MATVGVVECEGCDIHSGVCGNPDFCCAMCPVLRKRERQPISRWHGSDVGGYYPPVVGPPIARELLGGADLAPSGDEGIVSVRQGGGEVRHYRADEFVPTARGRVRARDLVAGDVVITDPPTCATSRLIRLALVFAAVGVIAALLVLFGCATKPPQATPPEEAPESAPAAAEASAAASGVERCIDPRRGQITPPCVPPATLTLSYAPVPFNAPTRYGGEGQRGNERTHVWIKAGEPPRPCGPVELGYQGTTYKAACRARVGDALYEIGRVNALAQPQAFAESSMVTPERTRAVQPGPVAVRRVDDIDSFGVLAGERFCRVGSTVCTTKRRFHFVAVNVVARLQAEWSTVACRACGARAMHFWPESHQVNSWTVLTIPDDAPDQNVRVAYVGGDIIVPQARIRDLAPITYAELK